MTARNSSKWLRLIIYILIVATTVYLPRNLGWTQPLEMVFYDFFTRLRPSEPIDERIVIVGLTEEDIKNLAALPIDDDTLAQLIRNISKYNPRVIGMDLHRNVPTGSGYYKLESILKSTRNLVGVEKTNQGSKDFPAIPPNPEIEKNGMSSASDLIVDSGDIVRRGYLYVSKSSLSSEQIPSFGLKLALEYLKKEGINPTSSGDKEHNLKLGNTVFPRLENNQEFYTLEDIDDYQILINFRSSKNSFKTISFAEVLKNNIKPSLIQDKIVIIGALAPTLGDNFFTPKSRKVIDFQEEIFGVEIHAYQTSQIISAALNDRKIIQLIPSLMESSWSLIWIITPSVILIKKVNLNTNLSGFYFSYISINFLAFITIVLINYLSLIAGYWIPIVNPAVALISSAILGYSYAEIIKEKQLAYLLKSQLEKATEELRQIQGELIAKEKLKAYEKLSIKMAHEIRNYLNAISLANNNSQYKLGELEQFLEENSFLFEDIYESTDKSPKHIANYFNSKFNKIDKNINKISLVIESILAENIPSLEPAFSTNVNKLINKIIKDADWIKSKVNGAFNITIDLNCASDLPKINIAPMELERVMINLLANASDSLYQKSLLNLEYAPVITLTTTSSSSAVEIKVRDNGMGISQDNLELIFVPFWTTKSSVDGVGVGLFFSQQRIEKNSGTISVSSTEGEWTEFTITLPKSIFDCEN
ncbi:MAG: hypothetical protein RLZZ574_1758 [Cyanobacteriota bacterium]|jgi:CHASE2 domain-containing sensor protein